MAKLYKRKKIFTETPPITAAKAKRHTSLTVIDYSETHFLEKKPNTVEECFPFRESNTVTWVNVDGLDLTVIEQLGKKFGIHPLVLENIANIGERPKVEDLGEYIHIVLKMLSYNIENNELVSEQVSLVVGENFVISFQERPGWDVFDGVREALRSNKGRIRKMGADYLGYELLDALVDSYFSVLEAIGEEIGPLEDVIINEPVPKNLQRVYKLREDALFFRKSIWPLREVIAGLSKGKSSLIHETTQIYLRDVYDHTIQVMDTVETYREIISGMLDIYLSSISNRMNEVMKVLTVFMAVFIPLTFIASIYGMNFKHMPELLTQDGYYYVLAVMAIIALGMLSYFRKKKWI